MANLLFPAASCTALLAGAAVALSPPLDENLHDASVEFRPTHKQRVWLLSAKGQDNVCLITRRRKVSNTTSTLDVDLSCPEVFRDSELIVVWQQDKQGNVTLADRQGNAILEFADNGQGALQSISGEPGKFVLSPNS